jgi:hypothetical protein
MGKCVGLVGNIRNKVGNFVFSTWKGIQVVKAYQPTVANPRSAGQTAQRSRFDYAVQYAKSANNMPYLKHIWGLITPQTRSIYNEIVSRNLQQADFFTDNTLAANRMIISDNNDYIQNLVLPGDQACAAGVWTLNGLDVDGCGVPPDGLLMVQVFQANLLADPEEAPFRDCHMCEEYVVEATWPDAALVTSAVYETVFDICKPLEANLATAEDPAALWLIPVWSNGVDASTDPTLITKVGVPVLVFLPTP